MALGLKEYFNRYGWLYGKYGLPRRILTQLDERITHWFLAASLAELGRGSTLGAGTLVHLPQGVRIGEQCQIGRHVLLYCETMTGQLTLGQRVCINDHVQLDYSGVLRIEDDVLISRESILYTHDHGLDPRSIPRTTELVVGRQAWIGARAIVLPSVSHVGAGAIVGAGSIVTKNVPPGAIVAGNPAKVIRIRPEYAP